MIADCPIPCPVAATECTVATFGNADDHNDCSEMSCAELSLKVPIAEKVKVAPGDMNVFAGFTAIEPSVAEVTLSGLDPWTCPSSEELLLAVTVVDPADRPLIVPCSFTTEATERSRTDHVNWLVKS